MLARLHEFVGLCRKNGMRVSTAELLDTLRAVEATGLQERETLRNVLLAALCKRRSDLEIVEELFDLFFFRGRDFFGEDPSPLVAELKKNGISDEELEHILANLADEGARMGPLLRMGLGMRRGSIESLLRLTGVKIDFDRLQSPLQIGFFAQQLVSELGFRQAFDDVAQLEARLGQKLGAERAQEIGRLVRAELDRLKAQARRHVEEEFQQRNLRFTEKMRTDLLSQKPFSAMSDLDLQRLRGEVVRLGRKLRDLNATKHKRMRRGRLDARRTLRKAMSSGGVPFALYYRHRRLEKPRLVILCDISDSVRHVSRFMLQLAFTLQEQFSKVRSFVFVSDIGECSDLFRQHELGHAVDLAYSGAVVNVYANSNFGRAFRLFADRHLDAVTSRTTVVVIGDGRNNYNPPEVWALEKVAERAHRVLWLNPESPAAWTFGDSAMRLYEPFCDRVETVNNLESLERVVENLIL